MAGVLTAPVEPSTSLKADSFPTGWVYMSMPVCFFLLIVSGTFNDLVNGHPKVRQTHVSLVPPRCRMSEEEEKEMKEQLMALQQEHSNLSQQCAEQIPAAHLVRKPPLRPFVLVSTNGCMMHN